MDHIVGLPSNTNCQKDGPIKISFPFQVVTDGDDRNPGVQPSGESHAALLAWLGEIIQADP